MEKNPFTPYLSRMAARVHLARAPLFFGCSAALALLAGCGSEPESHVVSAPPPSAPNTVVYTAPTPAPVATVQSPNVVVTQAPPALVSEAVTAQPSSRHVWIPGYWTWRNERYEWMAGHWEVPPTSTSTWVAPTWQREGSGYRFYEGHWE
jgi:hypothetical protein